MTDDAPTAARTARRSHAERRREAEAAILKAALRIIAKRGLDQLTLAEAGVTAGYSRALPAHYFGSREALMVAVAEDVARSYRARLRSAERLNAPKSLGSLLENVAFYIDDSRGSASRLRGFYEVLNAGLRHPALAPAIAALNADSAAGFARSIKAAQAAGEVRADLDADIEGALVVGALRGVMAQWLVARPGSFDLDKARDALVAGFRRSWKS